MSQDEHFFSEPIAYCDVESVLSNDSFTLLHYSILAESLVVWVLTKESLVLKELDKEQFVSAEESLYIKEKKEQENANHLAETMENMNIEDEETCENRSLDDYMLTTEQQCEDATESVSREGTEKRKAKLNAHSLEELYNTLIAPVLSDIQHDEIVIVPDGKMYTVPFAGLKDPNTGKYLSESKRIRLVPSIAVLKLLQECPVDYHSQQGALIVGNPSVGEAVFRAKTVAGWRNLKHANQEAEVIADILEGKLGSVNIQPNISLLTKEQATKDVVLAKMKEGIVIIHIAAHGDADHAEIVLTPIPSQDRQGIPEEQDYLLTMKEVQEVGVKAQLVVLSCCHSGRGEIRAEGMIGLSRAFLAAGARAVVASLWGISDEVTLSFMISFYESLCKGNSASVSLDEAMKEVRSVHRKPRHWAPFVLIGDDVTINFGQ